MKKSETCPAHSGVEAKIQNTEVLIKEMRRDLRWIRNALIVFLILVGGSEGPEGVEKLIGLLG